MTTHRLRTNDQDGATIIIVALVMLALLAIAALAIDGGQAFSSRRSTQNAADAAALAGTEALNNIILGGSADIHGAVQTTLQSNKADSAFTCELVDFNYATTRSPADIVSNTCPSNANTAPANAFGVLVIAGQTSKTVFANAIKATQFTTGGTAVAQIEKVTLTQASAPFFACGLDASGGGSDPPLLIADSTQTQTGGWALNTGQQTGTPSAIGSTYNVWGPQVPTCGGGHGRGGFHGLIGDPSFSLPSWINDTTGVRAGPTRSMLAGSNGCRTQFVDGCHVLLPVCDARQGQGSHTQLHCDLMAEFQLTNVGNNSADAILIGASSVLTFGTGGSGPPGKNDFRVIRLSV